MANVQTARVIRRDEGFWLSWLGNPVNYLAEGEQTEQTYAFLWGAFPPGDGHPQHRHDFEEGFYVLSGELTVDAGDRVTVVPAGGFVNVGAGTLHHLQNTGATTTEYLTIASPSGFEEFHREAGRPVDGRDGPFPEPDAEDLARIHAIALRHGIDTTPPPTGTELRCHVRRPGDGPAVDLIGTRYVVLATGEQTDGRYGLWLATHPAGGGVPPHVHDREHEGFYVVEGAVRFEIDGVPLEAGPGTFVNIPPGCVHAFEVVGEAPARLLGWAAPAGFEQMLLEVGTPAPGLDAPIAPPTDAEVSRLLGAIGRYGVRMVDAPHP